MSTEATYVGRPIQHTPTFPYIFRSIIPVHMHDFNRTDAFVEVILFTAMRTGATFCPFHTPFDVVSPTYFALIVTKRIYNYRRIVLLLTFDVFPSLSEELFTNQQVEAHQTFDVYLDTHTVYSICFCSAPTDIVVFDVLNITTKEIARSSKQFPGHLHRVHRCVLQHYRIHGDVSRKIECPENVSTPRISLQKWALLRSPCKLLWYTFF